MSASRIEITGRGVLGAGVHVRLNGAPVPGLLGIRLEFDRETVTVATLELYLDEVKIDAHALAFLTAKAEATAAVPEPEPCPHPTDARQDRSTFGAPRKFFCRACRQIIVEPDPEGDHG